LLLIVPPVQTTECAEILKLLCVALLDDHLSLDCDTRPFAGIRAQSHALQFASGGATFLASLEICA